MTHPSIINTAKQNLGANPSLKSKARELRKKMTEPERILWGHLRSRKQNGMYFRRQHPYGIYILDFYCFEANLAIEIDGLIHLSRRDYDFERTKYLQSSGLIVIRFDNKDVQTKIDWVLEQIKSFSGNIPIMEGVHHFPLGGNKKGGKNSKDDELA